MRGKARPQSKKAGSWWQRSHQTRESSDQWAPESQLPCWHAGGRFIHTIWASAARGLLSSGDTSLATVGAAQTSRVPPASSLLPGPRGPEALHPTTLMPPAPCMTTLEPQLPTRLFGELPRRTYSQAPASFLPLIPRKQFLSLLLFFPQACVQNVQCLASQWTLHCVVDGPLLCTLLDPQELSWALLWMKLGIWAVFLLSFSLSLPPAPFASRVNFWNFEVLISG